MQLVNPTSGRQSRLAASAVLVAAVAGLAATVAGVAVWLRAFAGTFEPSLPIASSGVDDGPGFTAPGVLGSLYTTVEVTVRGDVLEARWLFAASLAAVYSIPVVGLALLARSLWRLRGARTVSRSGASWLAGLGAWTIVAPALQKLFADLSLRAVVTTLGLPTEPLAQGTWVELPSFHISQTMAVMGGVGFVLLIAAAFATRAPTGQTEGAT